MSDRGETVLEHAVLVPIVLLIVLLGIQGAAYYHSANIAEHAASRGVTVASRISSSNGAGVAEATAAVGDSGSSLVAVSVTGSSTVRASVTVRVARIVPFFPSTVTRTASSPEERYVPEDER